LSRYCPPSVLVNDRGEIIHLHGRTGMFLEPPAGQPRMILLDMAREGLKLELASALRQAAADRSDVLRKNVRVKTNGDYTLINLSVVRILEPETIRGLLLVSFLPAPEPPKKTKVSESIEPGRVEELEEELQHNRESLQTTIEELQTSNEELKSTNEELQSTNEELQSTNEEMETSKEEMQSLNEELTTVNNELESKMRALGQVNDDMENLLNSTTIATIFLDNDLNIRRFTAEARNLIHMIETDIGRPIADLASHLIYDGLLQDCAEVLKTLAWKEAEIEADSGSWYQMRILPYRTSDNKIDGLVVTFIEISEARAARRYFQSIVETVREPLVVLDERLEIISCNTAFYETFRTGVEPTAGRQIYEIGNGQWNDPALRQLLEAVLPKDKRFEDFRVETNFPTIGRRIFLLNGRKLERTGHEPGRILLAMEAAKE
jgi:two-component system CheB/CheR fusion protein